MADTPTATATPPVAKPVIVSPASIGELKTAFPKADATFICAQLERAATLDQARVAWSELLEARDAAHEQEIAKLKAAGNKPGVSGISDRRPGAATPTEEPVSDVAGQWEAAITAELKKTGGDRAKAVRNVCRANPELHQAYVESHNAANPYKARK